MEKITNDILRPASKSHILDEEKNTEHAMKAIRMEHDSIKQKLCYVLGQDWDQNVKIIPDFEEGSKHLLSTRGNIFEYFINFIELIFITLWIYYYSDFYKIVKNNLKRIIQIPCCFCKRIEEC